MRRRKMRSRMRCCPARSSRRRADEGAGAPRAGAAAGTSKWTTAAVPGWLRCCGHPLPGQACGGSFTNGRICPFHELYE